METEIRKMFVPLRKSLTIVMSVLGIGFISATVILAEICNYKDFDKAGTLASWCGLVPSFYQSANKNHTGSITKQGSGRIRRILVEVAHVVARTGTKSRLKDFFLRIKAKKGTNIAAVALARKLLCIIHHILMNREMYLEDENRKEVGGDPLYTSRQISLDEMIRYVVKAGYEVRKRESGVGG